MKHFAVSLLFLQCLSCILQLQLYVAAQDNKLKTERKLALSNTQILSMLYVSTNGSSWTTNTNWLNSNPCPSGNWYGILCSGSDIVNIFLGSNRLQGTLPSQIGMLSAMASYLYLFANSLTGPIPSEIGQMTGMASNFNLYYNSFSGSLPSELGLLTVMTYHFDIETNDFSGSLPSEFGQMTSMQSNFFVRYNNLTGLIPSEFGQMTVMTSQMDFKYNSLSGPIPSEFGLMTGMNFGFSLRSNSLTGLIPSQIAQMTAMTSSFYLASNNLSGPIPSQFGLMTAMKSYFWLFSNSLTGSIPSELGRMTVITQYFDLFSNKLCGEVPTEVSSLSSQVSFWDIITSNDIGTPCCETLPLAFTCSPTTFPTLLPSLVPTSPTVVPTPVPTVTCVAGQYYYDSLCVECPGGRYSYFTSPPFPTSCSKCQVGKYNTAIGATECIECATGKLSSSDRTYCEDCIAGEYNFNNTECVSCENGKYAPQALTDSCLECSAGFHTNNATHATTCTACDAGTYSNGSSVECDDCSIGKYSTSGASSCVSCSTGTYAPSTKSSTCTACSAGRYASDTGSYNCTSCSKGKYQGSTGQSECSICDAGKYADIGSASCTGCDIKYSSNAGSSSCSLAASDYYLQYPDFDSAECPSNTKCLGAHYAPLPDTNFWVDRSKYEYAADIYKCPRETCKGAKGNSSCWQYSEYNRSDSLLNCDSAELLCTKGAEGHLCGSCDVGFVYRGETKTCSACGSAKSFAFTVIGIGGGIGLLVVLLVVAHRYNKISLAWLHLESFDSGSLKVLWVTYQIIMSVSWNLDIKFPPIFSRMLSLLSVLSLDMLSLECFHTTKSANRYFVTIYLWSVLPICLAAFICFIGVLRIALRKGDKTTIINQHAWLLLLLSYLVLPPVVMKQLQGLDCIPFKHDGNSYLRVDTGVNCRSSEYYVFKAIVILFFCCYQLIPVTWMVLLYRKRGALYIPRGPNEKSALTQRDADPSLSYIRFLFKDYRGEKWWFEVAEMYRRIIYIGVLPLFTPNSSKRASLGCMFAIISFIYFREEEPFRVSFTNNIACVAQLTILLTFYTALSIDSGVVFDFGLGDLGIGLFLIIINLLIFALVIYLAYIRYRKIQEEKQWRKPLTTQQLEVVNRVMNEGNHSSPSEEGSEVCMDDEGIELSSLNNRKSLEEHDKISSQIMEQYLLQPKVVVMTKRVGAGAFGEVFKGTCMGETVAIKTMIDVTEENVREFKAEIILTASLRHPNIVNFVGACWGKELMCLVLEWVAKGSLRDLLETPDLKREDPLLKLASDMARGMNYLHNRKFYDEREEETVSCILHRDLKPDNALISEYIAGKLADFGTSRSKAEEDVTMTSVGTPLYVAPEIARGEHYDESVDVYSFGLTLMEMCIEQPILDFIGSRWVITFDKKKIPKQPMRLIRPMTEDGWRPVTDENPIEFAPPSINSLIINCCNHDPSKRPSFKAILELLASELPRLFNIILFNHNIIWPYPRPWPYHTANPSTK